MLFNSIDYLLFFPTVTILYFMLPFRLRWLWLLFASYFFYMSWNPKYIVLILISTVVDYVVSLMIDSVANKKKKRQWLYVSLLTNLGILFVFKYFNFFTQSVERFADAIGWNYSPVLLQFLLPVGISFYTFQTLSYTIDVYNQKVKPERHLGYFALYVCYFPQLVAGPIERPGRLIPQLKKRMSFDVERIRDGLILIGWGLFKKAVIADRAAPIVNEIFAESAQHDGLTLLIGVILFAFQIFGDFSGYSDIAIGSAKILGHDLIKNFDRPYYSKSISEFWQRWHISLSSWFRDYVYIPLGGNRVVKWRWYYNLLATFMVSGLWHGAAFTFVIWGALHGGYLIISLVTARVRKRFIERIGLVQGGFVHKTVGVVATFTLVNIGWVFFRAESVGQAVSILGDMKNGLLKDIVSVDSLSRLARFAQTDVTEMGILLVAIVGMEFIHYNQRKGDILRRIPSLPIYFRWPLYYAAIMVVLVLGVYSNEEFIYFQF